MIEYPLSALVIVALFNDNFSFMLLRMCLSFFHMYHIVITNIIMLLVKIFLILSAT
jgi:hypothetical protein